MSRNFELLQNLGKEREMFEVGLEMPANPAVPQESPVELKPLKLEMEAIQKEEVAKLVQRVFLLPGAKASHFVVFSGTEPGNGCSWICSRAAEILASQVTGSICVVDANLRSPTLHRHFQVENHHGLSDSTLVELRGGGAELANAGQLRPHAVADQRITRTVRLCSDRCSPAQLG